MGAKDAYLVLYNSAQAVGWALCLGHLVYQCASTGTLRADGAAIRYAELFQLASALEILHSATGLVRSSALSSLMQWAGRSHVLLVLLRVAPQLRASPTAAVLLVVWSLVEVIRYPWYTWCGLTADGSCPGALTWLRYTAFIPLYPVGVIAEMKLMWDALPGLAKSGAYSIGLPNAWNFAFSYSAFIKLVLLVYPFLWWQLYSQLLSQRRKKVGSSGGARKRD